MKRLEVAANILLIVVTIMVGLTVVSSYRARRPAPRAASLIGRDLAIRNIAWSDYSRTLLLILTKECHFCRESSPFYRRLVSEAHAKHVRVIAIMPDSPVDARQYLAREEIAVDCIVQLRPTDLRVAGTPTLLTVNRQGVVEKEWVGKLPPEKEEEVIWAL
jgi:thiol-disulfide isomerase/thioredoxin